MPFQKYGKKGGKGGIALAEKVLDTLENKESHFEVLYENGLSLKEKIETIAKEIYGAATVSYAPAAEKAAEEDYRDGIWRCTCLHGEESVFFI